MFGALDGLRVIDLSRLLPGPFATQLLADYGADVVKVEEPGTGDYLRSFAPVVDGESRFFLHVNRNKRSIALNLKNADGKRVLLDLAARADVLVESFRPGVMDRLGLGWDVLRERNPRLIYCALTGYGLDGPYRDWAGHDVNYLGYAGALALLKGADGRPVVPGFQIADLGGGGLNAVLGILLALAARERTGRGQRVDAAMVDGVAPWLLHRWAFLGADENGPGPNLSGEYPCYGVYEASDGRFVAVGALEEKFWARLCEHLGRPEWIPQQYADGVVRERMFDELRTLFRSRPRDVWAREFAPLDCCVTPVLEIEELAQSPHWQSRGLVQRYHDPKRGPQDLLGFPVKLSETPASVRLPAPALGEHTGAVLGELGYSREEVGRLLDGGGVARWPAGE